MVAAAVTVLAVARDDGAPAPEVTTDVSALGAGGTDQPPAPWASGAVPRSAVPAAYADAWDRAGNRGDCALLFPLDGGPELAGAQATAARTPEDRGWDIFLTGDAGSVEVLGLFDMAPQLRKAPATPSYTRTWSDGSVAKYAPDVGNLAPGTYDPAMAPFEAILTLPEQSCAYRIHDTLGRAHLESLFERLRLMRP
jgi:hypothetical protein